MLETVGNPAEGYEEAVETAMGLLQAKLGDKISILESYKLRFSDEGEGSHVDLEHKEIVTNPRSTSMTLGDAESYLVEKGEFKAGEFINRAPWLKDKPWGGFDSGAGS